MGTADAMSAIRVRKYDIERLKKFKMNNESAWETLARILNEYQHSLLTKEVSIAKFKRTVMKLEQCFKVYEDDMEMDVLSFHQIRDWYNERTKDGITSARLINLLRKRPQFVWQHTERKIGSNETLTYWSLNKTVRLPNPIC